MAWAGWGKQTDVCGLALAGLRGNAEGLRLTRGDAGKEYGELVAEDLRETLAQDIANLRAAIDGGADVQDLRSFYAALESSAYRIAEVMYGSAEGGAT